MGDAAGASGDGASGGAGAGRGSRLGSLASDVPSSRLGKLGLGLGDTHSRGGASDVSRGAAGGPGGSSLPPTGGPTPGVSRLGSFAAGLGTTPAVGAAPAAGASAQPRKTQFVPKVPTDRPRAAARDVAGTRGTVAASDSLVVDQRLQALIRQTQEDAARVEARSMAGRGRGRGDSGDRGRPSARATPAAAVTFGGVVAARPTPAAAGAAQGDTQTAARRIRTVREREKAEEQAVAPQAPPPVAQMEIDEDDEACTDDKADSAAWLDTERYYPTVLPFSAPEEDASGVLCASDSPLADLGLLSGASDGRLLLVQMPALLPVTAAPAGASAECGPSAGRRGVPQPLEALQDGLLGQLLVYASGAVKLRIGEVVFDVMPGAPLSHSEQVAALNCEMQRCAFLGAARSRVVLTPDVDALLDGSDTLAF